MHPAILLGLLPWASGLNLTAYLDDLRGTTNLPGCSEICNAAGLPNNGGGGGGIPIWTVNCLCGTQFFNVACFHQQDITACCSNCSDQVALWNWQVSQQQAQQAAAAAKAAAEAEATRLAAAGSPCNASDHWTWTPHRLAVSVKQTLPLVCTFGVNAVCGGKAAGDKCDDFRSSCPSNGNGGGGGYYGYDGYGGGYGGYGGGYGGSSGSGGYRRRLDDDDCTYSGGQCQVDEDLVKYCANCTVKQGVDSFDCTFCKYPRMSCVGATTSTKVTSSLAFALGLGIGLGVGIPTLICITTAAFCFWKGRRRRVNC